MKTRHISLTLIVAAVLAGATVPRSSALTIDQAVTGALSNNLDLQAAYFEVEKLISSTFLDMAVTPAVFYKFGRRAAEKYIAREEIDPLDAIEAEPIPAVGKRDEHKPAPANAATELAGTTRDRA